jgi:hypothetical protein
MANLLNTRGRTTWTVHRRERYPPGTGVLTDLARLLRRGPLANQRVVACAPGTVTFRSRVKGEASDRQPSGLMTVPIAEGIRRYRLPVPAPGTRVVRSSGVSAPTTHEAWAGGRQQLGQEPVEAPARLDWQTYGHNRRLEHPARGPLGGRRRSRRGVIPRSRMPPPGDGSSEVAAGTAGPAWAAAGGVCPDALPSRVPDHAGPPRREGRQRGLATTPAVFAARPRATGVVGVTRLLELPSPGRARLGARGV